MTRWTAYSILGLLFLAFLLGSAPPTYPAAPALVSQGADSSQIREVWKQVELCPATGTFKSVVVDEPRKLLYLAGFDSNSVAVFSFETQKFTATIPVGAKPRGMGMNPEGSRLYVCNSGGETITEVDLARTPPAPARTFAMPTLDKRENICRPKEIAVLKNGKALVLLQGQYSSEKPVELDLASGAVKEVTVPNVFFRGGGSLLFSSFDRNMAFLIEGTGKLIAYYPSSAKFSEGKSVGSASFMASNVNGSRLVAQIGGVTRVLDWNGAVLFEIPYLRSANSSGQVYGIAFNPAISQEAYRAREGNSQECYEVRGFLDVIDTSRGSVSHMIPLPDKPCGPVAVSKAGNMAFCITEKGLCVVYLTLDGEKGFF